MAGLNYLLWLATRKYLPPQRGAELLGYFGTAEAAYFAGEPEYRPLRIPQGLRQSLLDKSMDGVQTILERCDQLGVRILTCMDAGYPDRLLQLRDYPLVLYVLGRDFRFDEELTIAMVGARKCTRYGMDMAGRIGLELARSGALVISGIAQGIDSAAVRGALRGGGRAVSVLGCGVDVHYPPSSEDLYRELAVTGALISEYPPGTPVVGAHFPVRNRIISGLSVGVTAVEAAAGRSGTLITALLALDQGRDLFAVPGPANAPMSAGTNRLISRGEARLVQNARDILEEYRDRYPGRLRDLPLLPEWEARRCLAGGSLPEEIRPPQGDKTQAPPQSSPHKPGPEPAPASPPEQREEEQLPVLEAKRWRAMADQEREILTVLARESLTADELLERLDMNARQVNTSLTVLHSQGILRELPGRRFQSAVRLKNGLKE
jgi:DNA processing protein